MEKSLNESTDVMEEMMKISEDILLFLPSSPLSFRVRCMEGKTFPAFPKVKDEFFIKDLSDRRDMVTVSIDKQ